MLLVRLGVGTSGFRGVGGVLDCQRCPGVGPVNGCHDEPPTPCPALVPVLALAMPLMPSLTLALGLEPWLSSVLACICLLPFSASAIMALRSVLHKRKIKAKSCARTTHRGVVGFFFHPNLADPTVDTGTNVLSPPPTCTKSSLRDGPPSASSIAKISSPGGGGGAGDGHRTGLLVGEYSLDCRPVTFFAEPGGDILGKSFAEQSFWVGMTGTGISCNASHSLCFSSAARPSLPNRDTGD